MSKLPTPEQHWDGKAPEDNVTPEQFRMAVQRLQDFTRVNSKEVRTLYDLAKITRDVGISIQRLVLSCGELQITNFSYLDPRTINRGNALIDAGDVTLGSNVRDNAEKNLSDKTMIIRTRNQDGSSTISSVSAKSLIDDYGKTQMITNDTVGDRDQNTNYYATVPIYVDVDRMKSVMAVFAIDFREGRPKSFYPLQEGSGEMET